MRPLDTASFDTITLKSPRPSRISHLFTLAEKQGAPLRRALARRALGTSLFFVGQLAESAAALDEGIAIDDAIAAWEDPTHLLLYTERAGVVCRSLSARALWFLGFPDRALERVDAGLTLAQGLAHAYSLAFALTWAALLHNLRREFDAARRRAESAIGIAREHHMAESLTQAPICRGFALVGLGLQTEGIAQLRTGLADWNRDGVHFSDTQWLAWIAEAHLQADQFDDALVALDRAAEIGAVTTECHYEAELHRLKGVVLAQTREDVKAVSCFQRAIETARSQQAKSLELRAATNLAKLWADHGERQKASDLLAPVYGWFTEGFDTADLKDAKALLDELA